MSLLKFEVAIIADAALQCVAANRTIFKVKLSKSPQKLSTLPEFALGDADKALLSLLQSDARTPVAQLARELGVARATVQERIRRMEEKGIIDGYTVRLGTKLTHAGVHAHTLVRASPKGLDAMYTALRKMSEVQAVAALSGEFDALVTLHAATTTQLDDALDALGRIPGIERTQTSILLSIKFQR